MRFIAKIEYLIVAKGTKFTGSGKLGLKAEMINMWLWTKHVLQLMSSLSLYNVTVLHIRPYHTILHDPMHKPYSTITQSSMHIQNHAIKLNFSASGSDKFYCFQNQKKKKKIHNKDFAAHFSVF